MENMEKRLHMFPADAEAFSSGDLGIIRGAVSAVVTEERNGVYELDVECSQRAEPRSFGINPRPNMIILAKPNPKDEMQPFRISTIKMDITGAMTIAARHISYDLNRRVVFANGEAKTLPDWMTYLSQARAPFVFSTDITTEGTVAAKVPTPVRSFLGGTDGSLLQKFGGEFRFDGFNVALLSARSSGVWNVRYGSNMTKMDYRLTNEDAYNSFYAFWRGADDTVVSSYASVQAYIGDEDGNTSGDAVRTAYDRVVIDVSDQFDSTPTQAQVREAGRAQLLANYSQAILPSVAVAAADAPGVFGQDWSELRLCDTVNIFHPMIGRMAAKIIKTKFDPLQGKYTEITIGTPRRTLPKRLAAMERRMHE